MKTPGYDLVHDVRFISSDNFQSLQKAAPCHRSSLMKQRNAMKIGNVSGSFEK